MKTTRPVRALLIRGARRDIKDKKGRKPIDLADLILTEHLKLEAKQILKMPRSCSCLQLSTPLKKTKKEFSTTLMFYGLLSSNYLILLLFILPCIFRILIIIDLSDFWFLINTILFLSSMLLFAICMVKDPGYLEKP